MSDIKHPYVINISSGFNFSSATLNRVHVSSLGMKLCIGNRCTLLDHAYHYTKKLMYLNL